MQPFLPDCGVLTTPRSGPKINLKEFAEKSSPKPSCLSPWLSKPRLSPLKSPAKNKVILSTGFSFGFYKSKKVERAASPPRASPVVHSHKMGKARKKDGFNKGVGHKIKKPNNKAKDKLKNEEAKNVVRRMKDEKIAPCYPSDRADRSPLKRPSPRKVPRTPIIGGSPFSPLGSSADKKKKRVLSSPGISLLEDAEEESDTFVSPPRSGAKFFTSRSRAAATVQIGKTIQLAAKQGDISLKQRNTKFVKKNVGRVVEEQLDLILASSSDGKNGVGSKFAASFGNLPSVQANPRPLPTRVLGSPSPKKQSRQSPRKTIKNNVLNERPQTNAAASPQYLNGLGTPNRRSPRKSMTLTIDKENQNGFESPETPRRKSPRKLMPSENSSSPANSDGKKLFAVFDPRRKIIDKKASPITKKSFWGSKRFGKSDDSQMMIDAGQRNFGATQCNVCGVLYEIGNPADEASHQAYHDGFVSSVRFTGWKTERVVRELDHIGGRVIMVGPTDAVHAWRKVEEIREIVDRDLGFSDTCIRNKDQTSVYMYILDKRIIGCLIAEKIDKAYRVVPQESKDDSGTGRLFCCSNKAEKVYVGINRIWVHSLQRGRGVATILADSMRANMFPYTVLTIDQFAFSDPTESGMAFAEAYTRKPTFLVYRR